MLEDFPARHSSIVNHFSNGGKKGHLPRGILVLVFINLFSYNFINSILKASKFVFMIFLLESSKKSS